MTGHALLMRNRNFLRYFVADVISTLGSQLSFIAFPLLVLALKGSLAQAGVLGTVALIARLAARLPAGQLVDRCDRRWLMLATDLVRLIAIGSIPLAAALDVLGFSQLLVVAVIEGLATAVFAPASGVAVRDVVAKPDLTAALSLSQSAAATAMLLGPALGGLLFSVNRILPFTCDAASYAISAVLLIRLRVLPPSRTPGTPRDTRFSAGLRWLSGQPNLLWVVLHAAVLNMTGAAAQIGVVLVLRAQGQSGSTIGLVMACAGIGAVLGSILAPKLIGWLYPGLLFLMVAAAWAGGFAILALRPAPVLVGAVLVLLMVATPATGVVVGEAIIGNAPRELLGRVNTAVSTSLAGLASLGPLLMSLGISRLGIPNTWLVMSACIAGAGLITVRPLLRMRTVVETQTKPAAPLRAEPEAIFGAEPVLAAE